LVLIITFWVFRNGSLTEIVGSQQGSSAIKRSAEPIQHPISAAISFQFGQKRPLSNAPKRLKMPGSLALAMSKGPATNLRKVVR
jgi:hypothetical protein